LSSNIQVAALSDVGCVRTNNEDNFGYDPVADLYVVCDGMGGMAAGEVASAIACGTAITTFASQPVETPIQLRLALAIRAANDAVVHSGQLAEHKGMGTTLVCAAFEGSKLLIGNVGDSRCYLFQNGACMQVTLDHSYVNELVRAGTIKIEDIPNLDLDQFASVITRAIGAAREVEPDFFFIDLHPGDAILLASDGLTRYVEGSSISELVDPANLQGSCQQLIDKAKAAGGADNITCILLRYDAPATTQPETQTEAPLDVPVDVPSEAQPHTPAEAELAPPAVALDTPVETPTETQIDTPAEASADEPTAELDAPAEAHTEAQIDTPAEAPDDGPAAELDAPAEAHTEPQIDTPAEAPDDGPAAELDVPAEAHTEAPAVIQTDAPTEAQTDAPATTQPDVSFDALLDAAAEAHAETPSSDPLDALFEAKPAAQPEAEPVKLETTTPPISHEQQL
jgi:serine/threonine protein phosphatase PrpC